MKLHPLKVPEFWWFQVPPIHFDPKPGDQWVKEFPLALLLYQIPHFTSGCLPFCGGNFELPLIPKYLIYLNSWKPDKKWSIRVNLYSPNVSKTWRFGRCQAVEFQLLPNGNTSTPTPIWIHIFGSNEHRISTGYQDVPRALWGLIHIHLRRPRDIFERW